MATFGNLFGSKPDTRSIMQILDDERENYVSVYLQAIAEAKSQHELAMPEVKVEMSDDKFPKPYRYYTLDIFCRDSEKTGPIEVNIRAANPLKPRQETWKGLNVTLYPLVWNGLEFRLDGDLSSDAPLLSWMSKWMDIEDKRPKDENHLSGIVHNVTCPEKQGSRWSFSVDFGTAPLDALVELVEVIRSTGAKNVEMGSFGYRVG